MTRIRHDGRRWAGVLLAGTCAAVAYRAAPLGPAGDVLFSVVGLAILAGALGPLRSGDLGPRGPWVLTLSGLAAFATRPLLTYAPGGDALRAALIVAGYALLVAGTSAFVRRRSGGQDRDGLVDGLIVGSALVVVLWQTLTGPRLAVGGTQLVLLAAFPLVAALLASLAIRMMLLDLHRVVPALLLFASTVLTVAANVAAVLVGRPTRAAPPGWVDVAWLTAYTLVVAAAHHPRAAELTALSRQDTTSVAYARLGILALAVLAVPLVTLPATYRDSGGVVSAGSLLLVLLVVWRIARLVRDRDQARRAADDRTERQAELVALGSSALSGAPLAVLFEEAVQRVHAVAGRRIAFYEADGDAWVLRAGQGTWPALVPGAPGTRVPTAQGGSAHEAGGTGALRPGTTVLPLRTERAGYGLLVVDGKSHGDDFLQGVANTVTGALERRRSEQEIRHAALHDGLTGLPNRVLLAERLETALRAVRRDGRSLALLFIDLDGFKAVNDTHGHRAGDQLLTWTAHRLVLALPGALVARISGDEFVVLHADLAPDEAAAAATSDAAHVVRCPARPFDLGGVQAQVSASVGVAVGTARDDADSLLRRADDAMYRAKQTGKGRYELCTASGTCAPVGTGPPHALRTA